MITRKAIEARLADLKQGREQLIEQLRVQTGAILDCEHWLTIVDAPEQEDGADANVQTITNNPGFIERSH